MWRRRRLPVEESAGTGCGARWKRAFVSSRVSYTRNLRRVRMCALRRRVAGCMRLSACSTGRNARELACAHCACGNGQRLSLSVTCAVPTTNPLPHRAKSGRGAPCSSTPAPMLAKHDALHGAFCGRTVGCTASWCPRAHANECRGGEGVPLTRPLLALFTRRLGGACRRDMRAHVWGAPYGGW